MYKKIISFTDTKSFGNKIDVYKGSEYYFVVICEFGLNFFYFVDLELENWYPAITYLERSGFVLEDSVENDTVKFDFQIDLWNLGFAKCPEWLKKLIKEKK